MHFPAKGDNRHIESTAKDIYKKFYAIKLKIKL